MAAAPPVPPPATARPRPPDPAWLLARELSWDNLKRWGFDIFLVDELSSHTTFQKMDESERSVDDPPQDWDKNLEAISRGCPMVLVGWAILASPYSQLAMAKDVRDDALIRVASKSMKKVALERRGALARSVSLHSSIADMDVEDLLALSERSGDSLDDGDAPARPAPKRVWDGGYFFVDDFKISPRAIAAFLRKAEGEYGGLAECPYHNNVHGADVVQSTHSILQMAGNDMALQYTALEVYALLLAAALHDIRHPGTNNNYQVNAQTALARLYNDRAVLENMHASRASDLLTACATKDPAGSALGAMTRDQQKQVRTSVICDILGTDMSRHSTSIPESQLGFINLYIKGLTITPLLLALPPKIDFKHEVEVIGQHGIYLDKEKICVTKFEVVILVY